MNGTPDDGSIGILELKEQIGDEGSDLAHDAMALLRKCRRYRPGWLTEPFHRTELIALESQFDALHTKFLAHGGYVSSYLSMATKPMRSADEEGNQIGRMGFDSHFPLLVFSYHLTTQYESLRAILADIGDVVSSHRSEANNRATMVVALASLVVAVASLVAAVIAIFT